MNTDNYNIGFGAHDEPELINGMNKVVDHIKEQSQGIVDLMSINKEFSDQNKELATEIKNGEKQFQYLCEKYEGDGEWSYAEVELWIDRLNEENKNLKINETVREEKLQELTLENKTLKKEIKQITNYWGICETCGLHFDVCVTCECPNDAKCLKLCEKINGGRCPHYPYDSEHGLSGDECGKCGQQFDHHASERAADRGGGGCEKCGMSDSDSDDSVEFCDCGCGNAAGEHVGD